MFRKEQELLVNFKIIFLFFTFFFSSSVCFMLQEETLAKTFLIFTYFG